MSQDRDDDGFVPHPDWPQGLTASKAELALLQDIEDEADAIEEESKRVITSAFLAVVNARKALNRRHVKTVDGIVMRLTERGANNLNDGNVRVDIKKSTGEVSFLYQPDGGDA